MKPVNEVLCDAGVVGHGGVTTTYRGYP
jgi:hypothetical protein